ncbi:MAG: DUF1788 domain-containing protein [Candidatus Helarchaeota archaeon]
MVTRKIEDLDQKFEELYQKISHPSFLKMEALGGEIPFYITTYYPEQQNGVDQHIRVLKNRLQKSGIKVYEINLYELAISILKERGIMEKILESESGMTKERLLKILRGPLDIKANFVPAIQRELEKQDCDVVFFTGIGLVFPFIRSHNILNNLQSIIKDKPAIFFFPGIYNGKSLELFGRLKDDNYYRAFNLDNFKVR